MEILSKFIFILTCLAVLSPVCVVLEKQSERETPLGAHQRAVLSAVAHSTDYSVIFLGKVTALGVLCCFAFFLCLPLLASFFIPSHLLLKHVHCIYLHLQMYMYIFTDLLIHVV